ncbi:MAG: glycosyltransferase [Chloroflexi bacterium]|nr:glycosyltransferase [Chloroflexota bacterium]
MKLLLLTPQLPYPPQQGTTIRNFNLIRNLAPRHAITLLSFGTPEELRAAAPLRELCRRIEIAPYPARTLAHRAWTTLTSPLPDMALRLKSAEMHTRFDSLTRGETFDVIQVEGIEMARYVLPFAPRPSLLVFDDHNAEYVLQRTAFESDARRAQRWHAALYSLIQWQKLTRYERAICRAADHIVACSDADANAIRALIPNHQSPITVIPNGVDTELYTPVESVRDDPALVFTGKMDYRPNVDAMTWFAAEILPRVRAEIPRARLIIVGQKPAPKILALKRRPGIEITGWVADIRSHISAAAIYVVPLRMGSGTRLKVLEAMAMGQAIVSTTRGVEGIALTRERDVVIADTPEEFARATIALLRAPERRRTLGRAARALAEERYDWRAIVPAFDQAYASSKFKVKS